MEQEFQVISQYMSSSLFINIQTYTEWKEQETETYTSHVFDMIWKRIIILCEIWRRDESSRHNVCIYGIYMFFILFIFISYTISKRKYYFIYLMLLPLPNIFTFWVVTHTHILLTCLSSILTSYFFFIHSLTRSLSPFSHTRLMVKIWMFMFS